MGYNDFFIHYHNHSENLIELLNNCIDMSNIRILNYIIQTEKKNISSDYFTGVVFSNEIQKLTKGLIYNIINNFTHLIEKKSPLISACIFHNIEEGCILELLENGFSFTGEDMEQSIKNKQYIVWIYFI